MGSLAFVASSEHTPVAKTPRERKTPIGTGSPRKARPDVERERERKSSTSLMDEGTQEVIRRLDGLGKTSTGSLKARARERETSSGKNAMGGRGESCGIAQTAARLLTSMIGCRRRQVIA